MNGTFEDFLAALLAFESGWDRERYQSGEITDAQLDDWANGSVGDYFPLHASWSDLTDDEWQSMAYRSMNFLGFVGYQFGEALLIDLGYYDSDYYYGNGAPTITWEGDWTGKNGVDSLEEFMTEEAQETAIREAFGHNLTIIETMLAAYGESLDDYIGDSIDYSYSGGSGTLVVSLTGILAGAHLRGAPAVVDFLRSGGVSIDELGTPIVQYMVDYGGYDSPGVDGLIDYFESRLTGDEGLGTPDTTGSAGVDAGTADVVIDWVWGQNLVVDNFDPQTDTIFVGWFSADQISVAEFSGNVVFSIPGNNQTITLEGVGLDDLDHTNFTFLDLTTAAEILALVGTPDDGSDGDAGSGDGDTDNGDGDADNGDGDTDNGDAGGGDTDGDGGDAGGNDGGSGGGVVSGNGTANVTKENASVVLTWAWGANTVLSNFDPSTDTIFIDWFSSDRIDVAEVNGNVVFSMPGNNQTVTLEGLQLSDLSAANFTIMDSKTAQEILGQVGADPNGDDGNNGNDGGEFGIIYDDDGSNPPSTTGTADAGGVKYQADYFGDDITNFDVARDELDFGDTSVHNMIINKTPQGELIIDNPWWDDMQIVQGVAFDDFTAENFGIVGNEHLRQDIGGVLSWELGVGPRDPETVYIRSHEYGVQEVIDNFDPTSMKISFLYYGTRERLSVEDTDDGLVISTQPSGQSFTFTGITLADLQPGTIEFHHDQVMEDKLEEPFGFNQNDVALVSREDLLTPQAPDGATTDGHQTREGIMWSTGDGGNDDAGDSNDNDAGGGDDNDDGAGDGDDNDNDGGTGTGGGGDSSGDGRQVHAFTWNWGATEVITDFDPSEDVFDFGSLPAGIVSLSEVEGDLLFEILNNGGHTYVIRDIQAEDLSAENLAAPGWNGVLEDSGGVFDQLSALGNQEIA